MSRLTLQSDIQQEMKKLGDQVELCNSDGKLIGYFTTPQMYHKLRYGT